METTSKGLFWPISSSNLGFAPQIRQVFCGARQPTPWLRPGMPAEARRAKTGHKIASFEMVSIGRKTIGVEGFDDAFKKALNTAEKPVGVAASEVLYPK